MNLKSFIEPSKMPRVGSRTTRANARGRFSIVISRRAACGPFHCVVSSRKFSTISYAHLSLIFERLSVKINH
jgi:hypothetical protein